MQQQFEIVVGVDGSAAAYSAVDWAAQEAALRGCGLLIVHATDPHAYGLWTTPSIVREGLRDLARPYVESAAARAALAAPDVPVRTRVMVAGSAKVLVRLSRGAALTVIGQSGRSAASRAMFGSIAERVLANARGPVVAVPHVPAGAPDRGPTRVVIAVDDPAQHRRTLRFAFDEAQRRGIGVRVVHVPDGGFAIEQGGPGTWLAPWRAEFPGVSVTYASPRGRLVEALDTQISPSDLLVIGHHRPVFAPGSLGRHGRTLFRHARCAIAVVGEPDLDLSHAPVAEGEISYDF